MFNEVIIKEPSDDVENDQTYPILDTVETTTCPDEAIISLHSLSGISTPQTLKIKD